MKKLIFGLCVLFPFFSYGNPSVDEWGMNESGVPISYDLNHQAVASYNGNVMIITEDPCDKYSDDKHDIWDVNRKKINVIGRCTGAFYTFKASVKESDDYIKNQLKTGYRVDIGNYSFPGYKFSEMVQKFEDMYSWKVNKNNVPVVKSQSSKYDAIYNSTIKSVVVIENYSLLEECQASRIPSIMDVNGTPVKFRSYCMQNNKRSSPVSKKGKEFLLDQFKTKNSVIVGGITFSAKGFAGSLRNAERKEKEAL